MSCRNPFTEMQLLLRECFCSKCEEGNLLYPHKSGRSEEVMTKVKIGVRNRRSRSTARASTGGIKVVSTSNAPKAVGPYSQGIRAGGFVFCAGTWGFDPKLERLVEGGVGAQTRQTLRNIGAVLEAAGSSLSRVVKATIMLHDWKYFPEMNEAFAEFFPENPPARSTVVGPRWPEGSLVAIEAIALA